MKLGLLTEETFLKFAAMVDKRLDALEANATKQYSLSLTVDGWTNDSGNEEYPYQYVLTVEGVTTASRADALFDDDSQIVATDCGVSTGSDTAANTVILKSRTAPTAVLTGILYVTKNAAWTAPTLS